MGVFLFLLVLRTLGVVYVWPETKDLKKFLGIICIFWSS